MSANGHFFVGAHMPVSLQKTTQIISGIAVIIARIAYASTNKTQKSLELRWDSFCYPRVDMPQVHVCIVASSLISTKTCRRALADSVGGQMRGNKEVLSVV